jgi:putative redox protein
MQASARWIAEKIYEGTSQSGHTITMDTSPEHAKGPSPMELVLTALCGCTSVDVVSILTKKREPLLGLTVSAVAEQAHEPPAIFTHIHLTYKVSGAVSRKAAEDAVRLSETKYCSVAQMLTGKVQIDYSIEIEGE